MHDYMLDEMAEAVSKKCGIRLDDAFNALIDYWQDKIACIWDVDEMLEAARRAGKPITRADAVELLKQVFDKYGPKLEITWLMDTALDDYCLRFENLPMMCKADDAIWKWLSSLLMDEISLMAGIQEMIQRREDDIQPKRERYDYIVKMLEVSTEKIRRLIDELADFDGELIKATVKEKIKQLEIEHNMFTEEKIRLASELAQFEIPPDIEKKVLEIASKVSNRLPNATFNGMREILELLDVKVTFYNIDNGIKLHVTCLLPNSDENIVFSSS
jgi:hypothetical protein